MQKHNMMNVSGYIQEYIYSTTYLTSSMVEFKQILIENSTQKLPIYNHLNASSTLLFCFLAW